MPSTSICLLHSLTLPLIHSPPTPSIYSVHSFAAFACLHHSFIICFIYFSPPHVFRGFDVLMNQRRLAPLCWRTLALIQSHTNDHKIINGGKHAREVQAVTSVKWAFGTWSRGQGMMCELRPETSSSWSGDKRRESSGGSGDRQCFSPEAGLSGLCEEQRGGRCGWSRGGGGEGRGSVEQVTARRELSFLQEERLRVRETTSPRSPSHIRRWHSQE